MSSIFINGSKYSFSKSLGTAIAVTAITNASPAVASATAPPADGSIVVVSSGWGGLDQTVARTTGAAADAFSLEGVDTTSTTKFPAGGGAGSVQVVSTWSELSQIRSADMSGGEQQYFSFQYVDDADNRQRQKPTYKNPQVLTLGMDYDPEKGWYADLIAADAAGEPVVIKCVLPNGATFLYYAYPSFNQVPTQTLNENMQNTATFSLITKPIRYDASA